ncbi:MAG: hypothetical protein BMS9Abin28_1597 [Anaerolineae bacterium]|nr:MAG: hypothetical protein BMS9Abin28_1597 [Anaerolineae bacterium]
MGSVSDITNRKWVLPLIALIIGVAIGMVYAWVINPVEWVDGEPQQLRSDLQEDYLRMAIDSYSVNKDAELALIRYQSIGENGNVTLVAVSEDPQELSPNAIQGFRAVIEIDQESSGTEATEESRSGILGQVSGFIIPICGGTVLIGLLLAVVLVMRARGRESEEGIVAPGISDPAPDAVPQEQPDPAIQALQFEPEVAGDDSLATFRTIYSLGDDDYDDSFSIESPTGDFLGECGVGIGDLIGAGEPNKVSAFEVWLFDKNDIQTVTKVVMSNYAYNDAETRNRLSAKGDPTVAEPGGVISLQTASLEVEARIVDMTYGESALPSQSFFERLTIEIRAWSREAAS